MRGQVVQLVLVRSPFVARGMVAGLWRPRDLSMAAWARLPCRAFTPPPFLTPSFLSPVPSTTSCRDRIASRGLRDLVSRSSSFESFGVDLLTCTLLRRYRSFPSLWRRRCRTCRLKGAPAENTMVNLRYLTRRANLRHHEDFGTQ